MSLLRDTNNQLLLNVRGCVGFVSGLDFLWFGVGVGVLLCHLRWNFVPWLDCFCARHSGLYL